MSDAGVLGGLLLRVSHPVGCVDCDAIRDELLRVGRPVWGNVEGSSCCGSLEMVTTVELVEGDVA